MHDQTPGTGRGEAVSRLAVIVYVIIIKNKII